jgi:hypothetical protein
VSSAARCAEYGAHPPVSKPHDGTISQQANKHRRSTMQQIAWHFRNLPSEDVGRRCARRPERESCGEKNSDSSPLANDGMRKVMINALTARATRKLAVGETARPRCN